MNRGDNLTRGRIDSRYLLPGRCRLPAQKIPRLCRCKDESDAVTEALEEGEAEQFGRIYHERYPDPLG
jgi:hypothetical protein